MKTCGIYGFRNTTDGKWYVGQSLRVEVRKNSHLSLLRMGKHFNPHLQGAFSKYGEKSLEFHILEVLTEDMLDIRERAWIEYYKSMQPQFGYNINGGGHLNKIFSPATRAKISAALTGRKLSPEHCAKMSASLKGRKPNPETSAQNSLRFRGEGNPYFGKHHTPEIREK